LLDIAGAACSGSTTTDFLLGRFLGRSSGQLRHLGARINRDSSLKEPVVGRANAALTGRPPWADIISRLPKSR
jgi:hypothetical protein